MASLYKVKLILYRADKDLISNNLYVMKIHVVCIVPCAYFDI